jgi:hypothetical protein
MLDNLITNEDIIEFDFPDEDFIIYLDKNIWYAEFGDKNVIEDVQILEDLKNDIKFEETEIFETGYVLTKELFDSYKKLIGEKVL